MYVNFRLLLYRDLSLNFNLARFCSNWDGIHALFNNSGF